jgi:uncharacterized membrane protein YqjE
MDSTAPAEAEASAEHVSTIGALRRIGETLLSTVHNRLELIALEWKEEKYWATSTLMVAAAAIAFAILSVVAVFVTIAFLCPPGARPWVLIGLCLVCIGASVFSVLTLKKRLQRPPVFAETLDELKKDIACLKETI